MEKQLDFYNTIDLDARDLQEAKMKAGKQQTVILEFFRKNHLWDYTPFEIQDRVLPDAPITSIRRAITNLTKMKFLARCDTMKKERLGKPNYLWRYNHLEQGELARAIRLLPKLPEKMKILLVILVLFLFSCEKFYCWECISIVENKSSIDTLKTVVCDINDVEYYESLMSATMTVIKDTITTITTITTKCEKL